jgi:hypothetical protein
MKSASKFFIAVLVALALFAIPTHGQSSLPDAPVPHQSVPAFPMPVEFKSSPVVFRTEAIALVSSDVFDMVETDRLVKRGGYELNTLYGKHPSGLRLFAVSAPYTAAQILAVHITEHSQHRAIRWLGRAYTGYVVEQHLRLGACDTEINTQSSVAHNCSFVH